MVCSMVTSTMEENDTGKRHNDAREGAVFKGRSGIAHF